MVSPGDLVIVGEGFGKFIVVIKADGRSLDDVAQYERDSIVDTLISYDNIVSIKRGDTLLVIAVNGTLTYSLHADEGVVRVNTGSLMRVNVK